MMTSDARMEISYLFQWPSCPIGTLRLGHITLNPEAFRTEQLIYRTHNGGDLAETFPLNGEPANHLTPVSTLVSSNNALGITSDTVELGDNHKRVCITADKTATAVTGHIVYAPVEKQYLYRLVLSAMEMDDTACHVKDRHCFDQRLVRLTIGTNR
jgi:hypothetical protein